MQYSQFTRDAIEKFRAAQATYFGIDAKTATKNALVDAHREYLLAAEALASFVLIDIDAEIRR